MSTNESLHSVPSGDAVARDVTTASPDLTRAWSEQHTTPFAWASSPLGQADAELAQSIEYPPSAAQRFQDPRRSFRIGGAWTAALVGACAAVCLVLFAYSGSTQSDPVSVAPGVASLPTSAPVVSSAPSPTPVVVNNGPAGIVPGDSGTGKTAAASAPSTRVPTKTATTAVPTTGAPTTKRTPPPEPCKKYCTEPGYGQQGGQYGR